MTDAFRPSNAARVIACPLSATFSAPEGQVTSSFAEEGRRAHAYLQNWLSLDIEPPEPFYSNLLEAVDYPSANGRVVLGIERAFPDSSGTPGGTADIVLLNADNTIEIADLKYGSGICVEPDNNAQMLRYLIGARKHYGRRAHYILTVIQPRYEHPLGSIRSWRVSDSALDEFDKLWKAQVRNAKSKNPRSAWGDHCRFCKGIATCQTFANGALGKAVVRGKLKDADALDVTDIEQVLDVAELIPAWLGAVKSKAYQMLSNGEHISGWHLGAGRARRAWSTDEGVEATLGALLGDVYSEPELLSAPQMEKKHKKHVNWQDAAKLITTSHSAPTLVRGDAPLAASAAELFSEAPTNTKEY